MKKILVFLATLVVLNFAFSSTAFAADYGYEYPDYVPVSGGAFFEVKSSLGTVAVVFPIDYKDGYFGFVDSGSGSVGNISRSTINGYVYTRNGQVYTLRAVYGEYLEYQTNNFSRDWVTLNITEILNTNINLVDLTDQGRETEFQYYDFSYQEKFFAGLIVLVFACNAVLIVFLGVRYGNN